MKSSRLWWLPLACALVPALAVHIAWWLSVRAGYIPDCIPYLEGCTSISRAARHGTGNLVFKLVMIPCAFLQTALWVLAERWIRERHPDARAGRSLIALGFVAGAALALYATFLGTDGAIYQWLRRFGIVFYFGATFLALLVFVHRLEQLRMHRTIARVMLGLCALMLALGLASVTVRGVVADAALKDRLEDILEWHMGGLITLWLLALAELWRRAGR